MDNTEGVIPDQMDGTNLDQGAGSATVDPMAMVKSAVNFGRKSMGLPQSFFGGEETSFDEGGVVPAGGDVTADGNNGQPPVNPESAMSYLTGHGGVPDDIWQGMQTHVDPNGQMTQEDRNLAALMKAPDDNSRFALLQNMRQKYNGFAAGARAALKAGDMGKAAQHATEALQYIPTGHSVRFAPAGNGLAMAAKPGQHGGQEQQSMAGGGLASDANNPSIMATKGANKSDDDQEQSFENGGEFDPENTEPEEDSAAGVIPETADEATASPAASPAQTAQPMDSTQPNLSRVPQPPAQPQMLAPQQVAQVVEPGGFDKAIDKGFTGWLKEILSPLAQDWNQIQKEKAVTAPVKPAAGQPNMVSEQRPGEGATEVYKNVPGAPAQETRSFKGSAGEQPAKKWENAAPKQEQDPLDKRVEELKRTAMRLFPMVGADAEKRDAWIQQRLRDEGLWKNRQDVEGGKQAGKAALEAQKDDRKDARAFHSGDVKKDIAAMNNAFRTMNQREQLAVKNLNALIMNPGAMDNMDAIRKAAMQTAQQLNINPEDAFALAKNYPQISQGARPQQGGGAGGTPSIKQYNGKWYKRGPNGEAIEVSAPK